MDNNINIDIEHEKKKALIFKDNKTRVHISKTNGEWWNGIIDELGSEFFFVNTEIGRKLILYEELAKGIEPFNVPKGEKNGK